MKVPGSKSTIQQVIERTTRSSFPTLPSSARTEPNWTNRQTTEPHRFPPDKFVNNGACDCFPKCLSSARRTWTSVDEYGDD